MMQAKNQIQVLEVKRPITFTMGGDHCLSYQIALKACVRDKVMGGGGSNQLTQ